MIIVVLALPYMVDFTDKSLHLESFVNWKTITMFAALIMIIGLLSGSYPAMILSGFNLVLILKGAHGQPQVAQACGKQW